MARHQNEPDLGPIAPPAGRRPAGPTGDGATRVRTVRRYRYPLDRLLHRARSRGEALSDLEIRSGNVLFHNEGRHLTARDVALILEQGGQDLSPRLVARSLEALARRGIVQAIEAGNETFYDVNLSPHLHVFDPNTGTLEDAAASFVVTAEWLNVTAGLSAPAAAR